MFHVMHFGTICSKMLIMNTFGENLKSLRLEKNLSRKQLALTLSVSERLVSYWENGDRECNFDMLIQIADYFDVTLDYLLGRTDY